MRPLMLRQPMLRQPTLRQHRLSQLSLRGFRPCAWPPVHLAIRSEPTWLITDWISAIPTRNIFTLLVI
jgi:hypothetical protein